MLDGPTDFARELSTFLLSDRTPALLRRVRLDDAPLLLAMLARLSPTTWRLRYHLAPSPGGAGLRREVGRIVGGQRGEHLALVLVGRPQGEFAALAVAELVRDRGNRASADLAMVVRDDYQGRGIGYFLGQRLLHQARAAGITTLHADLLAHNETVLRLFQRLGLEYRATGYYDELAIVADVPPARDRSRATRRKEDHRTAGQPVSRAIARPISPVPGE
jgi:GNAT superfamily N-acetyltransferase